MVELNGQTFLKMLSNSANALILQKETLNKMNVFPIPDGDTGLNMSSTMGSVLSITSKSDNISLIAELVSNGTLSSSRGNSGTILATFFIGFAQSLKGKATANVKDILLAFKNGKESSYKMIMSPQEGTILTVMSKVAILNANEYHSIEDLFKSIVETSNVALKETPDLLPILKQSGVVDSGAYGFVIMVDAMYSFLIGKEIQKSNVQEELEFNNFDEDDFNYTYCCEGVIVKKDQYIGYGNATELKEQLSLLGGSEVFIETETLIKFHIHVNSKDKVLDLVNQYGKLDMWKVDNMKEQLSKMKLSEKTKYAIIPIVIGEGFEQIFIDSGAKLCVNGGDTLNVSFESIKNAIELCNADYVILFPNNKDCIPTCNLIKDKISSPKIIVIPTISMAQGVSSIMAFDEDKTPGENELNLLKASQKLGIFSISVSAKDTKIGSLNINKGEYVVLLAHNVIGSFINEEEAFLFLADYLIKYMCVTFYYGKDVDDNEAKKMTSLVDKKLNYNVDIIVAYGGQGIYRYLIVGE